MKKIALSFFVVLIFCLSSFAQQPAPQPTPVAISIDPASFDAFVGQYEDKDNLGGTIFSFFREDGKYYVRLTNQDKIEILPQAPNKFFLTKSNVVMSQSRNSLVDILLDDFTVFKRDNSFSEY